MRVKVGETTTIKTDVRVTYVCSRCGNRNVLAQKITEIGKTKTIMGINLDRNYQEKAAQRLKNTILHLMLPDGLEYLPKAAFNCKCISCGHKEPWSRMRYKLLDIIKDIASFIAVLSGMLILSIFVNTDEMLYGMPTFYAANALVFLTCIGYLIGLPVYKKKHNLALIRQTAMLPPESRPQVTLYQPDGIRHSKAVGRAPRIVDPLAEKEPIPAGGWGCTCGRAHPAYVSTCTCGMSKQQAKAAAQNSQQ